MNQVAMPHLRRLRPTLIVALTLLGILAITPFAQAAETYVQSDYKCRANSWGSGGTDENGVTYMTCGTKVVRFAADGTRLADVTVAQSDPDVAASPNGAYLYTFVGSDVRRMNLGPDGTYVLDATWRLASFMSEGAPHAVRARSIAVDAWGDLYLSNGGWYAGEPNVILKYAADGTYETQFGQWGNGVGEFNVNMGVAVSRDGRTVYTTENSTGRIQRFDWNGGSYQFTLVFGGTDTNCATPGKMAAPYDLAVDPWGFVYVMDTTCRRVQKFTGNGQWLGHVGVRAATDPLAHGLAVDRSGNFYVGQWGYKYTRAADNPVPGAIPAITPLPAPDVTAPLLTDVTVPANTTTQAINVGVTASDVGSGLARIRIANEDGNWTPWQAWSTPIAHTLTAGYGVKGITVQVADVAGNESTTMYRTLLYAAAPPPPADAVDPVLGAVAMPATTTTQDISVAIAATDNVAVTGYRIANNDGVWSAWTAFASPVNHRLLAGFGIKGFTVQVRDAAGNESNTIYKTISYVDPVAPPVVNDIADPVLISAAIPPITNTQAVTVTVDATDDTKVTRIRFANEDGNWGAWQPYAATRQWNLSAGYGQKLVFVQVSDAYWHDSAVKTLRTRYQADAPPPGGGDDTVAPVLVTVGVPAQSATQAINVDLTATDDVGVAQVRMANEDGNWGPWVAFAPTKAWTLTAGYTVKLVIVQVRDASGNESNVIVQRTQFVLNVQPPGPADTVDPIIRSVTLPNPVATQNVTLVIDATDNVAATQVRVANEDGNWGAWQAYNANLAHTLTAGNLNKLVFVQVRDAAGNESNVAQVRTLLQAP